MATEGVHSAFAFLLSNVSDRLESVEDARCFVKQLGGLTRDERSSIQVASLDRRRMEVFCTRSCAYANSIAHSFGRGNRRKVPHADSGRVASFWHSGAHRLRRAPTSRSTQRLIARRTRDPLLNYWIRGSSLPSWPCGRKSDKAR